ncbi:putative large subunit ribosomal protein L29e [Monocercomonoides exilis]|uniref:putative large subunit ribosomal protein L29e n=1 Tax=Monocercomonoides exilis TaxID=2049356 RepID=UPI0035599290|nr:putative large subunit ribosomal protein L29e [Monocercomonoides exilis]|eukprot:MONOS_14853.1-p1 / transcript=MONOS_14853.1 / gene=MONOS_14853 / organism=Monocercomonoides_exilis_PA203 / gene_product=unspecified product / transcript_product=unspecified product / location=Mono_scaffold01086:16138-16805(-) / protein_length=160 / sequence_SO=supercontig / SO=protein_coding / is_pseudo=false
MVFEKIRVCPRSIKFHCETMAKSKNHTNHNQNHKAHRNGIKKPQQKGQFSRRYMDQKYLRNLHFVRKHNRKNLAKFVAQRKRDLLAKKKGKLNETKTDKTSKASEKKVVAVQKQEKPQEAEKKQQVKSVAEKKIEKKAAPANEKPKKAAAPKQDKKAGKN